MHALVAAVLLRMTRLDPFNANTEPEPPDRKFAQVKQGMGRSEGHAVVAADADRHAALLKSRSNRVKAYSSRVEERASQVRR